MESPSDERCSSPGSPPEKQPHDHSQGSGEWTDEARAKQILEQQVISQKCHPLESNRADSKFNIRGNVRRFQDKLQSRIDRFREHASDKEWDKIEASRTETRSLLHLVRKEQETRQPDPLRKGAAVRAKVNEAWNNAAQVAFTYIQMLDVMVSQASELVVVAYGAVKIILAVQVNSQEVKEKVPAFLKRASQKFEILDHLTVYRPSKNLVVAIAQACQLYIKFLAKAVKLYTECRPSKKTLAPRTFPLLTVIRKNPEIHHSSLENRFQSIVDSIEEIFKDIHEAVQYHGLLETRMNLQASSKALDMLESQQAINERVLALVENLSQTIAVRFNKAEDVREAASNIRQRVEEAMDQPTLNHLNSQSPISEGYIKDNQKGHT